MATTRQKELRPRAQTEVLAFNRKYHSFLESREAGKLFANIDIIEFMFDKNMSCPYFLFPM